MAKRPAPEIGPRAHHGTIYAYIKGCRCVDCRAKNAQQQREKRRRNPDLARLQNASARAWMDRKTPEERRALRAVYRANAMRKRGEDPDAAHERKLERARAILREAGELS